MNLTTFHKILDRKAAHKTSVYSANCPAKTLVIHLPGCQVIPWDILADCGCSDPDEPDSQRWFCADHITRRVVDEFMQGSSWAILKCDICFGGT